MHQPLRTLTLLLALAVAPLLLPTGSTARAEESADSDKPLLSGTRQLTFDGRRSGEGYFSADGQQMVFQSEREEGNPFYQIYLMDLTTGDIDRLSPGVGKTTCAWIHPSGERALFASTHHDPEAEAKQERELEKRATGEDDRYEWDYDPAYELYEVNLESGELTALTDAEGYNAEASYSPDGRHILFASNRHAYSKSLSEEEQSRFEVDPSSQIDLYRMEADGSDVERLTDSAGYDGGPFYSADGSKIVWRRFDMEGKTAEIWTADADGSNQRQVTDSGVMSWAPFFHPSGDYIIYTNNAHGYDNFELHMVDAAGEREPVRVTQAEGFDGLPVFTPDGEQLAWTSNRNGDESQIFLAAWDDAEARRRLALDEPAVAAESEAAQAGVAEAERVLAETSPEITADEVEAHIRALASEQMAGRLTGTDGERMATAYVAEVFRSLGLEPAGDDGTYFQSFEFTAGVSLGEDNALTMTHDGQGTEYAPNEQWRPLAFSHTGTVEPGPVVFAGYGIVAPAEGDVEEYDSYVHLDVEDKWVLALRYMPQDLTENEQQHLRRYASLRHKAMIARDRGARGIIFVSGPNAEVQEELAPLRFDASLSGTSLPVVSVVDAVAADWLAKADKDLATLHDELDTGEMMMGFDLPGVNVAAEIDIEQDRRTGRNVLARLPAGEEAASETVMVGAHVDALGDGSVSGSLADASEEGEIHYGADDNASGVAAMLEVAEFLSSLKAEDELEGERDVLFAAWSGEELGLLGSSHFAESFTPPAADDDDDNEDAPAHPALPEGHPPLGGADDEDDEPSADDEGATAHGGHGGGHGQLHPAIAAYINMDMIGRYDESLALQGVGSSSVWEQAIERANVPVGLAIKTQDDAYLPTDSTPFYVRGVPILSAFTGAHRDYHTPRDTPDAINFEDTANIAHLLGLVTRHLVQREQPPDYVAQERQEDREMRGGLRAFLGTVPDYASDADGLRLSGVTADGPADEAGLQGGDVVIKLGDREVENVYDYTYAIDELEIGEETPIVIRRDGEEIELTITPISRE